MLAAITRGAEADIASPGVASPRSPETAARHRPSPQHKALFLSEAARPMVDRLILDCRHASRAIRRRPGYAAACVATMALVLGAGAAVFAAINATLFRPLGLAGEDRVVRVFELSPGVTDATRATPPHEASLLEFFRESRTLRAFAAYQVRERVLAGVAEPRVVRVAEATAAVLAMAPDPTVLGRAFTTEEDDRRERVIVLDHRFWREALGSNPDVIGKAMLLDGEPHTVMGVLARGFPPHFIDVQVWTPLGLGASVTGDAVGRANLTTMARLVEGTTIAQADAEIRSLMRDVSARLPKSLDGWTAGVMSVREWRYAQYRKPLAVLAGAMVLLVLVACVNLASLVLARVRARAGELALRRAMGATHADLFRLIGLEVLLLDLAGAACGLVLARAMLPILFRIDSEATRGLGPVTIDGRVIGFAFISALLVTLLAALLPGLHAASGDATRSDGITARTHGSRRSERWRARLLILQTSMCLALLVACGLLVRALTRSSAIAPGFEAQGVLTAQLRLSASRHDTPEKRVRVIDDLLERVRAVPGVTEAATGLNDFIPGNEWITSVEIAGRPSPDGRPYTVHLRRITQDYFRTMRITMLRGRGFDQRDGPDATTAIVISEAFARRFWPDEDPVGNQVLRSGRVWTVIGVAGNVADIDLVRAPEPTIYLGWSQSSTTNSPVALIVRTAGNPAALAPELRRVVRELDPTLPLDRVQPLTTFLDDSLAPQRFRTALLAWLSFIGLILGAVGVAGLTAQTIGERLPELAVRLVLGGNRFAIWRSAIGRQVRRVAIGSLLGALLSIVGGRVAATLLPEIAGFDAATLAVSAITLLAATTAASALAAMRILRLDPAGVLRRSG
jgi:putative ABC transport system permease protein